MEARSDLSLRAAESHRNKLEEFKLAVKAIDDLVCPMDDTYLLRFLRPKKFKVDEALKTIKAYYEMRRKHSELCLSVCPTMLKSAFEGNKGALIVLKERDILGRKAILHRPQLWNFSEYTFDQICMLGFFIMEEVIASDETQYNGIVAIEDWVGLSFNQTRKILSEISVKRVQLGLHLVQGSFPARFKGLHVVNNLFISNILYNITRPFMKIKFTERVHLHGKNLTALQEFFSSNSLPTSLGGELTDEEAEDVQLMNSLFNKAAHYKEMLQYGFKTNNEF